MSISLKQLFIALERKYITRERERNSFGVACNNMWTTISWSLFDIFILNTVEFCYIRQLSRYIDSICNNVHVKRRKYKRNRSPRVKEASTSISFLYSILATFPPSFLQKQLLLENYCYRYEQVTTTLQRQKLTYKSKFSSRYVHTYDILHYIHTRTSVTFAFCFPFSWLSVSTQQNRWASFVDG